MNNTLKLMLIGAIVTLLYACQEQRPNPIMMEQPECVNIAQIDRPDLPEPYPVELLLKENKKYSRMSADHYLSDYDYREDTVIIRNFFVEDDVLTPHVTIKNIKNNNGQLVQSFREYHTRNQNQIIDYQYENGHLVSYVNTKTDENWQPLSANEQDRTRNPLQEISRVSTDAHGNPILISTFTSDGREERIVFHYDKLILNPFYQTEYSENFNLHYTAVVPLTLFSKLYTAYTLNGERLNVEYELNEQYLPEVYTYRNPFGATFSKAFEYRCID